MKLYYDLVIITFLAATILPAGILLYHKIKDEKSWEARHKKLTNLFIGILLFCALCLLYGSFIEPNMLVINRQTIDIDGINSEIKIAFAADMQVGPYKKEEHFYKIIEKIKKEDPDIVLLGGDYIMNDGSSVEEYKYLDPLAELAQLYPTYAIHGNHEYGATKTKSSDDWSLMPNLSTEVKNKIGSLGIKYLQNEIEEIAIKDETFYLFGGDSILAQRLDLNVLNNRNKNIPTIALIHNPIAIWDIADKNIGLLLSGHTHGGQVRLPFIGPLGKIETEFPSNWYQGLIRYKGMQMFVTSGTGETGARVRFLNPPEIALLTIK